MSITVHVYTCVYIDTTFTDACIFVLSNIMCLFVYSNVYSCGYPHSLATLLFEDNIPRLKANCSFIYAIESCVFRYEYVHVHVCVCVCVCVCLCVSPALVMLSYSVQNTHARKHTCNIPRKYNVCKAELTVTCLCTSTCCTDMI